MAGRVRVVPGLVEPTGEQQRVAAPIRPQRDKQLWKWISFKELLFIFLACCVAAVLFQSGDHSSFYLGWEVALDQNLYVNKKFPTETEKVASPIVTDLDSDGLSDLLLLDYDRHLTLFSFPPAKSPIKSDGNNRMYAKVQEKVNLTALTGTPSAPISMATGFLRQYQSMVQVREQVVVVLMSDWTVLCLDHRLRLLWKANPYTSGRKRKEEGKRGGGGRGEREEVEFFLIRWQRQEDTRFTVAHFKKDRRKSEEPDQLQQVGDLAAEHISGLAFGGMRPHSSAEHVQDPNVLVIHSATGVDVLHLYQGRPLCSLQLSAFHSSHADIDGDGSVDEVKAIIISTEAAKEIPDPLAERNCHGTAIPIAAGSVPLFKHSICKPTHWAETVFATDKWIPALSSYRRRKLNNSFVEPLAPLLVPSSYHSSPLKLHLTPSKRSPSDSSDSSSLAPSLAASKGPLFDSIFVLSTGRVTSIGPHGQFNWQVDVPVDWNNATVVPHTRSPQVTREDVLFAQGSFTPSAVPFSVKAFGEKTHVLISGWHDVSLVTAETGVGAAQLHLPCQPIALPVVADYSNDGVNDIILTCPDRYLGFSLSHRSGLWHSTVLSLFIGALVAVLAVYTRQRTTGLLPTVKTAVD